MTAICMAYLIMSSTASALVEDDVYIVTMTGVELSEKQYNNLLRAFDHSTIITLDPFTIDLYKDAETIISTSQKYYIRVDTTYSNGEIVAENETLIREQLYNLVSDIPVVEPRYSATCGKDTHTTSYKTLTIAISYSGSSSEFRTVKLTNTWKKIPTCKSYDVIAISPKNLSMQLPTDGLINASGYMQYDGKIINYNWGSNNMKVVHKSGVFKSGVGLSQNIPDNVTSSLKNSLTVSFYNTDQLFIAYGSYQHATQDVTLKESQDYTISVLGMGSVIYFSDDVAPYYDDMQGVVCELDLSEYL